MNAISFSKTYEWAGLIPEERETRFTLLRSLAKELVGPVVSSHYRLSNVNGTTAEGEGYESLLAAFSEAEEVVEEFRAQLIREGTMHPAVQAEFATNAGGGQHFTLHVRSRAELDAGLQRLVEHFGEPLSR